MVHLVCQLGGITEVRGIVTEESRVNYSERL